MAVYFIRAGDAVKIGYSANPAGRMVKIQADTDRPVQLINEIDGGLDVERWAHHRFHHLRLRGEWFAFDNTMLTIQSEMDGADLSVPESPSMPKKSHAAAPAYSLNAAVEAYGSMYALCRRLGLATTTVYNWKYKGKVPAWRQSQINDAMRQDGHAA